MFKKGDNIVYPLYGAGIIEDIEEKEIDGEMHTYYVLRIPVGNLKIMISASNVHSNRIRPLLVPEEIRACLSAAAAAPVPSHENWNQRYKENMDKIKSGELSEVAGVYAALLSRERGRGLSTAEKKMIASARQIILSEVVLSFGEEKEDAEALLDKYFREE